MSNALQNQQIVAYEDLKIVTGESKPENVILWLAGYKVPYFVGRNNRPFVTIEALNSAIGLAQSKQKPAVDIEVP